MKYVFFGTPEIAVASLDALARQNLLPEIIVTQPDKPAGRGRVLTPPPVKAWADTHGIPTIQTEKINAEVLEALQAPALRAGASPHEYWDCFVLVAFGCILPQSLLNIPRLGVVNMHPSLLPKLRGPSPIRSALLTDARDYVGVTVMKIDAQMDHGPIIAQEKVALPEWPIMGSLLDSELAKRGGELLARTIPRYVSGLIQPQEQEHDSASYCKYIEKEHALISLADDPYKNLLKICAYDGWPCAYTFVEKNGTSIRAKIISAHIEQDELVLDRIIPEGKKEMLFSDFMRG